MSPGKICLRLQQLTTTGTVSMAANIYSIGTVPKRRITDDRKDAKVTTVMLPISVRYIGRKSKCCGDLSRWLNIYITKSRFLPFFLLAGQIYNTAVSEKNIMWKTVTHPGIVFSFRKEYNVKTVTYPDMDPVFGNNYWLQFQRRILCENFDVSRYGSRVWKQLHMSSK